ncbi:methylmalonyl-CoA carboxyltransferase [Aeromicrobium sp. 636]|uniref:Methylmalonyl-CoA carboxyltransferase n=1 Tax=Aeromicrobium senzhongii TaxID=2663859 RepID=A0A8I0EW47_9ACTN|nr:MULTISPECIES: carboxyl transferase domain-containing protein [Aeromicrobium]MBC9227491.1 methylmalonyl-CoA carboxyltransferase [Aeromicrobium senzhongii]MCQ3999588.1 methylmalonyl-CoA carboxyltransferase [Aeromicrobium sp. 636]
MTAGDAGWRPEVEELRRREELARRMGGTEKVARQHSIGKLTVRERIDSLLDDGSFREVGTTTGRGTYENGELVDLLPTNVVIGRGRIDDRPVVVGGDDFTVRGGASDAFIIKKQVHAEQMAHELRLPLVRMVDGTGGGGSIRSLIEMGRTYVPALPGWDVIVGNLSTVPVVALALGPCAGFGAARVTASHYAVMVRGMSQVFTAGPPVVAAIGQNVTKEELGGADVHGTNGTIDDVVDSEEEAFARARRFLSYLPSSVHEVSARVEPTDDPERAEDWLVDAVPRNPRQVYKVREILEAVVDTGSFMEIGRGHGKAAVTGFARLDGWPVAILANDPYVYGGSWGAAAARKVERFVDLAHTFHLPVVNFVDNPGVLIGTGPEQEGAIRAGVRTISAIYQADVPWCSVVLRKVFGVGGAGHSNHTKMQYRFAWPSADWGSLPSAGGIEAAYRAELELLEDPQARVAELQEQLTQISTPFRTAEQFDIEQIIDPRETRSLLCDFARLAAPLRTAGPTLRGMRP